MPKKIIILLLNSLSKLVLLKLYKIKIADEMQGKAAQMPGYLKFSSK